MKALLLSMLVAGTLPGVAVAREYACDMTALTRSERATYSRLVKKLRTLVQEQKELPSGYAFRFAPDQLETVARWVKMAPSPSSGLNRRWVAEDNSSSSVCFPESGS